ncbi:MAG: polymer-forming cytoskeletal protein [Gemmatimonadota bacterium]|jgi:cytoskeletal protein CcmA (bactofilin family)
MSRDRGVKPSPPDQVISIIGPGMKVVGDCDADGAVRIEGTVQGNIRAGKAVVVGKDGVVDGDIFTQDAVIAGRVKGVIRAESRLEVQATSRVEGEVIAARMQLEEGALVNGTIQMGQSPASPPSPKPSDPSTA